MKHVRWMVALLAGSLASGALAGPASQEYERLAGEVEASLQRDVLAKWFPAARDDRNGGFFENFNEDWSRGPAGEKNVVYQARLTWLSAQAAVRYPDRAEEYRALTRHGVAQLAGPMWDKDNGGFFWAVDDAGRPTTERGAEKHAYGIAFAIYAAATSRRATGDAAALELAQKGFRWLDAHAHDAAHGGYFEALAADGQPILTPPPGRRDGDAISTRYGYKSMNTHIHLLEAFTALHEVWPDEVAHARLREVFDVVREKVYTDPGCLHLYFNPDWRPVPEMDSFGHDIETAYLLVEAAAALGQGEDARTWASARRLVDHAMEYGFDRENGGFYDEGTAFGRDVNKQRIWWVQAEGLNALLLMHGRFGRETGRYWDAFVKEWEFIQRWQIDAEHGGWRPTLAPDFKPIPGRGKSNRWTEGYHQGRAMLNVCAELRKMAGSGRK